MAGWLAAPGPPQSPYSRPGQSQTFSKWCVCHAAAATPVPDTAGGCQLLPTSPGHAGKTPGFSDSLSS